NACRQSCNRPDCLSERITPQISFFEGGPIKDNATQLAQIMIRLRPSHQPILRVSWIAKQNLLDYIVYMCSGLSFWLGFCPLKVVHWMDDRARNKGQKTTKRTRGWI